MLLAPLSSFYSVGVIFTEKWRKQAWRDDVSVTCTYWTIAVSWTLEVLVQFNRCVVHLFAPHISFQLVLDSVLESTHLSWNITEKFLTPLLIFVVSINTFHHLGFTSATKPVYIGTLTHEFITLIRNLQTLDAIMLRTSSHSISLLSWSLNFFLHFPQVHITELAYSETMTTVICSFVNCSVSWHNIAGDGRSLICRWQQQQIPVGRSIDWLNKHFTLAIGALFLLSILYHSLLTSSICCSI